LISVLANMLISVLATK